MIARFLWCMTAISLTQSWLYYWDLTIHLLITFIFFFLSCWVNSIFFDLDNNVLLSFILDSGTIVCQWPEYGALLACQRSAGAVVHPKIRPQNWKQHHSPSRDGEKPLCFFHGLLYRADGYTFNQCNRESRHTKGGNCVCRLLALQCSSESRLWRTEQSIFVLLNAGFTLKTSTLYKQFKVPFTAEAFTC